VVRASERSFQVKWTETAFERGSASGTSRWTAILTIKVEPPRSAAALRKNPLGLFVEAIDWSEELEPPGARPPATRQNSTDSKPASDSAPVPGIPSGSPLDPNLDAAPDPRI
jgi:type IV secretion system protein VirB5